MVGRGQNEGKLETDILREHSSTHTHHTHTDRTDTQVKLFTVHLCGGGTAEIGGQHRRKQNKNEQKIHYDTNTLKQALKTSQN